MSETLTGVVASLHLTPETAETIRNVSFEGLKALPRRGAEIGGLITASDSSPDLGDDVVLVRCEYLFGPSYHLSANDLPNLRETAEGCKKDGKVVAAFFRSCTRVHSEVDEDDRRAISQACPEVPFAVIALPSLNGSARIQVYRRSSDDNWVIADEFAVSSPVRMSVPPLVAELPPRVAELPPGVEAAPPREALTAVNSATLVVPEPVPEPAPLRRTESAPARSSLRPTKAWLITVIALLITVVFLALRTRPWQQFRSPVVATSAPAVASVPLPANTDNGFGLAVRTEGGQLHLTWNRASVAVKSAKTGVLNIYDGATPVSFALAPPDLTEGSLLYTPHSADVRFQLRLRSSSGAETEEVIRVVGGTPAPSNVAAPKIEKTEKTPEVLPRRVMKEGPIFRPPLTYAPPRAVTTSAPASPAPSVAEQQVRPPAHETNATPIAPANTALNNPPDRPANNPPALPEASHPNAPSVTRDGGVSAQSKPEEPAAPPPSPTAPPPSPAGAMPTPAVTPPATIVGPTPVREVRPSKGSASWNVQVATTIVILVTIDASGNVTEAYSQSDNKGKSVYLNGLALEAARQWKFKPATLNGRPVASHSRIEFVFMPR